MGKDPDNLPRDENAKILFSGPGETFRIPTRLIRKQLDPLDDAYEQIVKSLAGRGCGAWHGRATCREPVSWLALGAGSLTFMTYRATLSTQELAAAAVLCDRHSGSFDALTADMTEPMRATQMQRHHEWSKQSENADRQPLILCIPITR
jgi:hypothetical protein